jgi:hypothetical protein
MKKIKLLVATAVLATLSTMANADEVKTAPILVPTAYVVPNIQHEDIQGVKIVVPLTTDSVDVLNMKLRNIKNSIAVAKEWHGDVQATVVLYSKGVQSLINPTQATKDSIDFLRSQGVKFKICNNSLKEQNLDFHTLYNVNEEDIVPGGFLEVAWLQQHKNFVVDPAN